MGRLVWQALAFGLAGMIAVPAALFFIVLIAAYTFDSRCGTPGDSGGCEMGAASIAIFSSLPGLAAGVALAVVLHLRRRSR